MEANLPLLYVGANNARLPLKHAPLNSYNTTTTTTWCRMDFALVGFGVTQMQLHPTNKETD